MSKKRVNPLLIDALDKNNVPLQACIFDFIDEKSNIFTIADDKKKILETKWSEEQAARQSLFEAQIEANYLEAVEVLKDSMNNATDMYGNVDYSSRIRAAGLLLATRSKVHDKAYKKPLDSIDKTIKHLHVNDGFNFSR